MPCMIVKTHACTSSLFLALNAMAYTILTPGLRDIVLDERCYQDLVFYVVDSCRVPSYLQHEFMFFYAILNAIFITRSWLILGVE